MQIPFSNFLENFIISSKSFADKNGRSIGMIRDSLNSFLLINSFAIPIALFTPLRSFSLIITYPLNLSVELSLSPELLLFEIFQVQ